MSALIPIDFDVTAKGISPAGALYAGHVGDHNAAEVTFNLSPELIDPDYVYDIEFVDHAGHWDSASSLPLVDGKITKLITNGWTQTADVSTIRLVVKKLPDDLVIYTADGKLYFAPRVTGDEQIVTPTLEMGLTPITQAAQAATQVANDAAANLETIDCYREA